MSVLRVTHLDVLHEVCQQRGLALLLTSKHSPATFASPARTELATLDVVDLADGPRRGLRKARIRAGDLAIRCDLSTVGGDLEAAAELLVGLLTRTRRQAA